MKKIAYILSLFIFIFFVSACGFQLQGKLRLAGPLHLIYIQASDPYGHLVHYLEQYLRTSDVIVVRNALEARTILSIMKDEATEELISVSSTQQTRQYNLKVTVIFQITDNKGHLLVRPQVLSENRIITVQASQILGSDNQTNMIYQQMRRMIAYAIMNRIASNEITRMVENNYVVLENTREII